MQEHISWRVWRKVVSQYKESLPFLSIFLSFLSCLWLWEGTVTGAVKSHCANRKQHGWRRKAASRLSSRAKTWSPEGGMDTSPGGGGSEEGRSEQMLSPKPAGEHLELRLVVWWEVGPGWGQEICPKTNSHNSYLRECVMETQLENGSSGAWNLVRATETCASIPMLSTNCMYQSPPLL